MTASRGRAAFRLCFNDLQVNTETTKKVLVLQCYP